MGALANVINGVVDAATGSKSGTSLEDFLTHFSSSEAKWINTIDPYNTFDVSLTFYPQAQPQQKEKESTLSKIGSSLIGSAKSAVKNAANNLTGGLVGSIMNGKVDIMKCKSEFKQAGQQSFMEWLASANLLVGQDDWTGESAGQSAGSPLEIQLGLYCQSIQIPQMKIVDGGEINTMAGKFPIAGNYVQTSDNNIQLTIVNTKVPLVERIFYPWMREVTLPWWSYDSQPYTTATMTIDFTKHSDIKYMFFGCKPVQINTQQPDQDPSGDNITRQVTLMFDYMIVTSSLKNTEKATDKLLSAGKTLFNSAAKMINA